METKLIPVSQIVTNAGTQVRAEISEETVEQYAEAMIAGDEFPAVVVFAQDDKFILADGFHRVMAHERAGFPGIVCAVYAGGVEDALRYALQANARHGLKRTNADKIYSVKMALAIWPNLSSRKLAETCAVSPRFVDNIREEQLRIVRSSNPTAEPSPRVGADGKERKMPVKRTEPKPEPAKVPPQTPSDEELYDHAVLITKEAGTYSESLLMREMRVPYTVARDLVKSMKANGVLAEPEPEPNHVRTATEECATPEDDTQTENTPPESVELEQVIEMFSANCGNMKYWTMEALEWAHVQGVEKIKRAAVNEMRNRQ